LARAEELAAQLATLATNINNNNNIDNGADLDTESSLDMISAEDIPTPPPSAPASRLAAAFLTTLTSRIWGSHGLFASQLSLLRSGLHALVTPALLTPTTLSERVVGPTHTDVALLRQNTVYAAGSEDGPVIGWFWAVMEELSEEDRRNFVRFAWAQDALPATAAEYTASRTRLHLKVVPGGRVTMPLDAHGRYDASRDGSILPRAHTCFFNVELPAYHSKEQLKAKLLYAIRHVSDLNADRR
jgi:hypothetical protein